ncbi:MAG TPA: SDR family oxidoreductase [Candidatus Baltobacteraceae bacterium]|nr:SDR family oxidoreductase [Candidatus Baltobacteraceae bacterium]
MSDQAILVTGASSGIGHATALLLAQTGYTVFAGVRKEADRQRLESEHENLRPVILDVTVPADLTRAVDTITASGLPLAGVVNNAGIAVAGPLEYLPLEEIRHQFEINVYAPIAVAQAMLPMLRRSKGRIVVVGSIAGRISAPFVGPYSASKAALASFVDALRQELAPSGIRVSLLEFAAVKTPIWAKGRSEKDRLVAMMPPEAMTHYGPMVNAVVKQTQHEEQTGMDPQVIAATILAALRASKPRERYLIGKRARIQALVAMLPPTTRDKLVKSAMKLP